MEESGKYTWSDGIIYEGTFKLCKITGNGKFTWPDGSSYIGEVVDGLRHGEGKFYCTNGEIHYEGQWFNGLRHGKGRLVYNSNSTAFYDGHWVKNYKEGHGIEIFESGDQYEGEWLKNKRHGYGTMHWHSSHEMYIGQWKDGFQHGRGKHIWILNCRDNSQYPRRNLYIGDFKNGMRNGEGIFHFANGDILEGMWVENAKVGHNRCSLNSSGAFFSNFKNDNVDEGLFKENFTVCKRTVKELQNTISIHYCPYSEDIQRVLFRNITSLKKVYNFYSLLGVSSENGEKPVLRCLQFTALLRDINIHKLGLSVYDVEGLLSKQKSSNPEEIFVVKDFLSMLLTIAFTLHKSGVSFPTYLSQLLSTVLCDSENVQGVIFSGKSDEVYEKLQYQKLFWKLYLNMKAQSFNKEFITYRDVMLLLKEVDVIGKIFSSSESFRIVCSGLPDLNSDTKLSFLEFYEVMLNCAKSIYKPRDVCYSFSWSTILDHFFQDHINNWK